MHMKPNWECTPPVRPGASLMKGGRVRIYNGSDKDYKFVTDRKAGTIWSQPSAMAVNVVQCQFFKELTRKLN